MICLATISPPKSFSVLVLTCIITSFISSSALAQYVEGHCHSKLTHCGPQSCAEGIPHAPGQLQNFLRYDRINCRCDRRCSLYGDCCVDYWEHCVNQTHPPVTSSKYSAFTECFSPLNSKNVLYSYFAVVQCPFDWPQDDIRQNCENDTLAKSQKLLTFPVNGPGETVFKNVYCAICHRLPTTHLYPWILQLWSCETAVDETPNFDSCSGISLKPPLSTTVHPHRCYKDLIDSCPVNATEFQKVSCENHTSLVFGTEEKMTIFKNVHCAECVQSLSSLSCHIHEPNINPSHSFVLLFNFTERSVRYVFKSWFIWGENALPQVLGICTQWQMYDPFQGTCRDLICPVGMTIQSGQCVQSLHNRIADYSSDTTIGNCFLRFLSSEGIENYTNYNSTTLVKIFQQNITNNPTTSQQIYVRAEFSVAKRIEDALHRYVYDEELNDNTSRLCNVTTLLLVASSQSNKNVSQHPICEGFTLHDVQLVDIDLNNNSGILYRTEDGHVYTGLEFIHATVYEFSGNARSRNISRETYLTLCDPFVGKSCPVLSFNTSEFLVEASGKDVVFVHKASGVAFPADDIWQLPDGSLRVCNFLHRVKQDNYPAWVTALSGFSFAGSIISVVCLLFALLTYSLFPSLRNQPGKIIMNLMVAFVLAQFVLMVGKISTVWLCVLRATVLHFIWLVVFSWMSVLAVELTRSFKSTMLPNKETDSVDCKVLKLGILAWGLPAIFVSVCFLVSKLGQNQSWQWLEYGGSSCWIVKPLHSFFVFGIPVAIFLLINFVMVTFMIFKVIANRRRLAAVQMTRKLKTDIMLCLKIIVLTGVTWSLFYAASVVDSVPFWYITVWINSLQGAFVSLMFILRDNVRALWLKKLVKVWGYCQCHHNGK